MGEFWFLTSVVYGISFFIIDSWLLINLRVGLSWSNFLKELLSCYFCMGFWVSIVVWYLNGTTELKELTFHGFAGATLNLVINNAILRLGNINGQTDPKD